MCKVCAVAMRTNAALCKTAKNGTNLDLSDACGDDLISHLVVNHNVCGNYKLSGLLVYNVADGISSDETFLELLNDDLTRDDVRNDDTRLGTAVLLTNYNVLRDVNETSGKITRVSITS